MFLGGPGRGHFGDDRPGTGADCSADRPGHARPHAVRGPSDPLHSAHARTHRRRPCEREQPLNEEDARWRPVARGEMPGNSGSWCLLQLPYSGDGQSDVSLGVLLVLVYMSLPFQIF